MLLWCVSESDDEDKGFSFDGRADVYRQGHNYREILYGGLPIKEKKQALIIEVLSFLNNRSLMMI